MPSLAEYNEISPKQSNSVGIQWKILQIVVYAMTAVCGYACAIIFGYWLQDLQGQCPLYADIKFLPFDNNTESFALEIDFTASKWGKDALCSFCQFVPILTAVYAFICGGSFACCGRGGRSPDGYLNFKFSFDKKKWNASCFQSRAMEIGFCCFGLQRYIHAHRNDCCRSNHLWPLGELQNVVR